VANCRLRTVGFHHEDHEGHEGKGTFGRKTESWLDALNRKGFRAPLVAVVFVLFVSFVVTISRPSLASSRLAESTGYFWTLPYL
jgi:hypothetical protein